VNIGAEKFSAIVSDYASACVSAKKIINNIHKHIIPIRCIAHHINLLSSDICKTRFSKDLIFKCMRIIKFFKSSHQANTKLNEEIT
jgi:hypothetical protein